MRRLKECLPVWPQMVLAAALFFLPARLEAGQGLPQWPQEKSDLRAESAVRFAVLPNGMRYALLRNITPPGQIAIRFHIKAGSLDETDEQQGLAHFLEHMAFKGSKRVPENEMIRILQRKGLAFGPDTNARTSYDDTVYMLDLPQADSDTLSTALMLMRETASELRLDAAAFDHERSVILAEERQRSTPQYRRVTGLFDALMPGQRITMRHPIGKVEVISKAPVSALRAFYKAHYRPERATLIVVGDIDIDVVKKEIEQRFSDWKAAEPPMPEPDHGTVKPSGATVHLFENPGGPAEVFLGWTRPFDAAPDTQARRRTKLVEEIGLHILNRRLSVLSRKEGAPFVSSEASTDDIFRAARITLLSADVRQEDWQAGLQALDQERRRIVGFGVSQEELNRGILEYRVQLQRAADSAETRKTTDIAGMMVSAVSDDMVMTSPADDLRLFNDVARSVTVEQVNQALRGAFDGSGPMVMLEIDKAPSGGLAEVKAAFARSSAAQVLPSEPDNTPAWSYVDFGPAGKVAARRVVEDLGLTMVRFDNGVNLTIKPTKFIDHEVYVRVDIGRGRLDLPKDRALPLWSSSAIVAGGLRTMTFDEVKKALAGKVVGFEASVEDASLRFLGKTIVDDLATQLQLLTAYASQPGLRPEAFSREKKAVLSVLPQYGAAPGYVMSRDLPGLMHNGDERWKFPEPAQVEAATHDDFTRFFSPLITSGNINVTIVGDVGIEAAIRQTAATFGALPARSATPVTPASQVATFPQPGTIVSRTHKGRADQAAALIALPVGDVFSDLPRAFSVNIAGAIFKNRLTDQFRIAEGAAYSPRAEVELSDTFKGYGYIYAYVETTPGHVERFFRLCAAIADDMRLNPVKPDELARARAPLVERAKLQLQRNEYWLSHLDRAGEDPRRLDLIRMAITGYQNVTAKDVQAVAGDYFHDNRAWRIQVLPDKADAKN